MSLQGSVMFSYIHSDPFCEVAEMHKTVTTSQHEHHNKLFGKLMSNPKSRKQVRVHVCVKEGGKGGRVMWGCSWTGVPIPSSPPTPTSSPGA
jgi:hypothetical protein